MRRREEIPHTESVDPSPLLGEIRDIHEAVGALRGLYVSRVGRQNYHLNRVLSTAMPTLQEQAARLLVRSVGVPEMRQALIDLDTQEGQILSFLPEVLAWAGVVSKRDLHNLLEGNDINAHNAVGRLALHVSFDTTAATIIGGDRRKVVPLVRNRGSSVVGSGELNLGELRARVTRGVLTELSKKNDERAGMLSSAEVHKIFLKAGNMRRVNGLERVTRWWREAFHWQGQRIIAEEGEGLEKTYRLLFNCMVVLDE